jgi:hypothetical protein
MVNGQWSVVSGLRTVVNGQWFSVVAHQPLSMGDRPSAIDLLLSATDDQRLTIVYRLSSID